MPTTSSCFSRLLSRPTAWYRRPSASSFSSSTSKLCYPSSLLRGTHSLPAELYAASCQVARASRASRINPQTSIIMVDHSPKRRKISEDLPDGVSEQEEQRPKQWFVGSIDQGTTSSRFLIFDGTGTPVASHQIEFKQMYPHSG